MSETRRVFLVLALLNVFWAPVNVVVRLATDDGMSPGALAAMRWTLLALVLGVALLIPGFRRYMKVKPPKLADIGRAMAVGALFFAPSHILYYQGLQYTTTVEGNVLLTTAPIWTVGLAFVLLREQPTRNRVVGLALGFVGAYIVAVGFQLPNLAGRNAVGNLMFLSGVILESCAMVLAAQLIRRSSGLAILFCQVLGGLVTYWIAPQILGERLPFVLGRFGPPTWIALGYLVLVAGMLGFCTWYRMVEKTPVNLMALTLMLQPPMGALFGWWFLGERVTLTLGLGTSLILAALWISANEKGSGGGGLPVEQVPDHQQRQHQQA